MSKAMVTLLPLVLGASLVAFPAAAKKPREIIQDLTVKAEELTSRDSHKVAVQELGLLKSWLDDARSYLQDEEELDLSHALDRANAATGCIEALLNLADAEDQAKQGQTRAEDKEKQVEAVNVEVKQIERDRAAVESGRGAP